MANPARKKSAPTSRAASATEPAQPWIVAAVLGSLAALAAVATSFDVVPAAVGLAATAAALLALLAERGLVGAASAGKLGVAIAIGVAWLIVAYVPFHALLFPGAPLHETIHLHAADPSLPVTISTAGTGAVDLVLEGELPPNPAGGAPIPVDYAVTFQDSASEERVVSGRFDDTTRTVRRGRRGTGTVLQPHHEERHMLDNPRAGDVVVTKVYLEPPTQSAISVTAYRHLLPSNLILAILGTLFVGAVAAADALVVPEADAILTLVTPAVIGTALILWTSNTAHPSVSSLIGAVILGAPLGLAAGALLRIAVRRAAAR